MSKRPSLAESMRQAVAVPDPAPAPAPRPTATQELPRQSAGREGGFFAATRMGKKKITAPLYPADHKRLRQLALERDATTEALLIEAISDLLVKYGKAGIGQGGGAA